MISLSVDVLCYAFDTGPTGFTVCCLTSVGTRVIVNFRNEDRDILSQLTGEPEVFLILDPQFLGLEDPRGNSKVTEV